MLCTFTQTETVVPKKWRDIHLEKMMEEDNGLFGSFSTLAVWLKNKHVADFHVSTRVLPRLTFSVYPYWKPEVTLAEKIAAIGDFCQRFSADGTSIMKFECLQVYDCERTEFDQAMSDLGLDWTFVSLSDQVLASNDTHKFSTVFYDNQKLGVKTVSKDGFWHKVPNPLRLLRI